MWKGLTALAGVYFMFLIEHFLTLAKMYKDKKQKVRVAQQRRGKTNRFYLLPGNVWFPWKRQAAADR